uniref:Ribosomal protein S13 n=1 Tax=Cavenderia fasciculata TaxID=261658 RepID=B2XXA3_CACFS|nr:ribosomal protein S13 [Cavenderia fasciculata]ABX45225.1 ribosomal protein S13 [Cavenderia fasciculata]
MIVIVLDQIVLNKRKKVLFEIKKKIAGMGESMTKRLCSMCGFLPMTYVSKISTKGGLRLMRIYKSFKGLSDYSYYVYRKRFNQRRSKERAYRSQRFTKGYPVSQRTRTNGKIASKKLDIKRSLDYFYGGVNKRIVRKNPQNVKGKWNKKTSKQNIKKQKGMGKKKQ